MFWICYCVIVYMSTSRYLYNTYIPVYMNVHLYTRCVKQYYTPHVILSRFYINLMIITSELPFTLTTAGWKIYRPIVLRMVRDRFQLQMNILIFVNHVFSFRPQSFSPYHFTVRCYNSIKLWYKSSF